MCDQESQNNTEQKIRESIQKYWKDARINALAHREAMNEARRRDSWFYFFVIITSLSSILFLTLSYITKDSSEYPSKILSCITKDSSGFPSKILSNITKDSSVFSSKLLKSIPFESLDYALISIFLAFASLTLTILSNHWRFSSKSEQHEFLHGSYICIAQRTRAAKNPTKKDKLSTLLDDIERDFTELKSRGIEPQHKHFVEANQLFVEIQKQNKEVDEQAKGNL